jgi:20S proteasome alpha/beta subunit
MLARIEPNVADFDASDEPTFSTYITEVVERRIPRFAHEYNNKHGDRPGTTLAMCSMLENDEPAAATVYEDGKFDYEDRFTAIGSGSLIAELFLRDSYGQTVSIEEGRKFVGYIIQRVSEVDSNVEGIEVKSINENQVVQELSDEFVTALQATRVHETEFSMNINDHLEKLSQLQENYIESDDD